MIPTNCLSTKDLCFSYGRKGALNNVSAEVPLGCTVGLLGANGSGKTTFLKILAGLIQPYSGRVEVYNETDTWKAKKHVVYHGSNPFYQRRSSIDSAIDTYSKLYARFDAEKAKTLFREFDFTPHARLGELSKGRLALALLILNLSIGAELYLLDEPFSGIDISIRTKMKDVLLHSASDKSSFLISTHELPDMERLFDEIIVFKDGEIILRGNSDDLRETRGDSITNIVKELI